MTKTFKNLSTRQLIAAARSYGLDPRDRLVIESAQQADELHGQPCVGFNGNMKTYWACDTSGRYDAARLLDGYLCEETRVTRCDDLAARQFERDAYGC